MSYNPTTWNTGDIVTAEKLNKIENALANMGGFLRIRLTAGTDTFTMDKTWQEIHDAIDVGWHVTVELAPLVGGEPNEHAATQAVVQSVSEYDGEYEVDIPFEDFPSGTLAFLANSADGYPACSLDIENGGGGNSNPAAY